MKDRDLSEVIKEEMVVRDKIESILKNGPKTVPEVAEKLKAPTHEVMYWMMAMRKYGQIVETEEISEEGYYKYKLAGKKK